MKKNEPISKIMTRELLTVHEGEPVSKLRYIFQNDGVHHIPVVSGTRLVGIVSWNDLLRVSFGEFGNQDGASLDAILDHTYKLADIMSKDLKTIEVHGTIRDAAHMLSNSNFHALPVVDGETLVGIVTTTDLVRYLADL
ncbi:MAG: CBS domain-containing protein [Planctomycetales bacterium]|nr:CBS domain-containing protein [Planctomycetales bacterium]